MRITSFRYGALTVLLLYLCWAPCVAAEFQAGVAVVDITAPKGYRMSGYFNERLNTGVKDPLHAKALVLRQGDTQAALVLCDLIGLPAEIRQFTTRASRGELEITLAGHSDAAELHYMAGQQIVYTALTIASAGAAAYVHQQGWERPTVAALSLTGLFGLGLLRALWVGRRLLRRRTLRR